MGGFDTDTESLFTLSNLKDFVPVDHPLRPIRQMVNIALLPPKALITDAMQGASEQETAITMGSDNGYDAQEFIDAMHEIKVIPL